MAHSPRPRADPLHPRRCHLCDDARAIVQGLLEDRARAAGGPPRSASGTSRGSEWERRFHATIPVLEIGGRRLELAISPAGDPPVPRRRARRRPRLMSADNLTILVAIAAA
jgi:hypothetical protein